MYQQIMSKLIIQNNQNVFDAALMLSGDIEAAFDLALVNDGIGESLPTGSIVQLATKATQPSIASLLIAVSTSGQMLGEIEMYDWEQEDWDWQDFM